ncbi:23S rRNA (guanosine(2251)-2'-O)-methyltransferase RlmB [Babesia caballi]|uniref:23S rRNA (Guanosine(2251)-2'-O)-methyltransferase RlmB n=1 Tax=Babesia caballi TaxID=5871 RepID=A0AAV4LLG5_BABCB|nr:23S rRNA (guanosine(2251)-2'-O)-methyltransferase RlmB [Babesia caballi]
MPAYLNDIDSVHLQKHRHPNHTIEGVIFNRRKRLPKDVNFLEPPRQAAPAARGTCCRERDAAYRRVPVSLLQLIQKTQRTRRDHGVPPNSADYRAVLGHPLAISVAGEGARKDELEG